MSFAYHAQALGFAAHLTRPTCDVVPSQASVALSQTGGEGYSTVKNFNYKGIFSFDEASSYVAGSMEHGDYNTVAMVTVRNLNVAHMIHADLIVCRVSSRHHPGLAEGEITFAGSRFEGLKIGGASVEPQLDHALFATYPTFERFAGMGDKEARELAPHVCWDPNGKVPERNGVITCSIVRNLPDLSRSVGAKTNGYAVQLDQFGTIYLGQIIMKPGYRRLSMLRFDLGCPLSGGGEAGGGEGNGSDILP